MSQQHGQADLYIVGEAGNPLLRGMKCGHCGHVAFPRQAYGCEKCGDVDHIHDQNLPCIGTLASFATVNLHRSDRIAAPFIIGEVKLRSGPTIRITMVETSDGDLAIGADVHGVLYRPGDPSAKMPTELRFSTEAAQ